MTTSETSRFVVGSGGSGGRPDRVVDQGNRQKRVKSFADIHPLTCRLTPFWCSVYLLLLLLLIKVLLLLLLLLLLQVDRLVPVPCLLMSPTHTTTIIITAITW